MPSIANRASLYLERGYPLVIGAVGATVGYLFGPGLLCGFNEKQWIVENIYVAVFTLGTVASGFGLTIYTFLLTTESGFIGRSKKSIYYRRLLIYLRKATLMSGTIAIVSIPGMVIKDVHYTYIFNNLYVSAWCGILTWTSALLFRVVHVFSILAKEHH
jgi:hypothetical protein